MKNNYNFPNKKITRGVASSPVVATSVASGIRAAHGCPHTQCAASRTVWPMRRVHAAAGVSGKGASHLSAAVTAALTLQTPWRGVGTPGMPRLHGEALPGSSQSPVSRASPPLCKQQEAGCRELAALLGWKWGPAASCPLPAWPRSLHRACLHAENRQVQRGPLGREDPAVSPGLAIDRRPDAWP